MTYATVMVNLHPGQVNLAALQVAGDLSERLHARVIGIAAGQLVTSIYADGYVAGSMVNQDREDLENLLAAAETEFRHALHNRAHAIEWRSAVTFGSTAGYVAGEARSADLIVTGAGNRAVRGVSTGDLVMQAGRPVLAVPADTTALDIGRIVMAWKDTREARRAAFDALPLLKRAEKVVVVEVAAKDDRADAERRTHDVAEWLGRHGITAEPIVSTADRNDQHRLHEIGREQKAGLIVAGAYGHSRMREWIIGGVTRSLLDDSACCSLLSH
jgi:nucleotide-binding universal stress UspA family protein